MAYYKEEMSWFIKKVLIFMKIFHCFQTDCCFLYGVFPGAAAAVIVIFAAIEDVFFASGLTKLVHGGYVTYLLLKQVYEKWR